MKTLGDVAVAALKKKKKLKKKEDGEETPPASPGADTNGAPAVKRTGSSGSVKLKAAVFEAAPALAVKTSKKAAAAPSSSGAGAAGASAPAAPEAAASPRKSPRKKAADAPPGEDDAAATIEALTASMESVLVLLDEQNRDFAKRLRRFQQQVEENDGKVRSTCALLEDKLDVIAGMQREMVRMRDEDRAASEAAERRRDGEVEELRARERARAEEEARRAASAEEERELEAQRGGAEGRLVVSRMRRELFVNTRARLLPPDPREWKVHHVCVWADSLFTGELDDSYTTGIKAAGGELAESPRGAEGEGESVFDAGAKLRVHLVNGRALLEVEDIFEEVGVERVGQLFALRGARSALRKRVGIAEPVGNGHAGEEGGGDGGGISSIARSVIGAAGLTVTRALAGGAQRAPAARARAGAGPRAAPAEPVKVFSGNLTPEAAEARLKQAQALGAVTSAVEVLVSFTGSASIWPHLSACIPGVLLIQQTVTGFYRTCFVAAVAAVAEKQPDGTYLGS